MWLLAGVSHVGTRGTLNFMETRHLSAHIYDSKNLECKSLRPMLMTCTSSSLSSSPFSTPPSHQAQSPHRTTSEMAWHYTCSQKKYTFITVTNKLKTAYNFGRTKITNLQTHLFGTTLREQLRTSIQDQTKWLSNYNIAVSQSASTLHHYFQQPGRPPGALLHRDLCPWAIQSNPAKPTPIQRFCMAITIRVFIIYYSVRTWNAVDIEDGI